MTASWIGLGLLAALGAAGVTIFSKIGLEGMDPTLATTLRSVIMSVVLVGIVLAGGRGSAIWGVDRPDGRSWTFLILAGVSGAVSWLAYFAALRVGASANVAVLDRLSLVLIIVFGAAVLGEDYGWRAWVGVALIAAGAVLVTLDARRPRVETGDPSAWADARIGPSADSDGPDDGPSTA